MPHDASVKCSRLLLSQRAVFKVLAIRAVHEDNGYPNGWLDVQVNNMATGNRAVFLERLHRYTGRLLRSAL